MEEIKRKKNDNGAASESSSKAKCCNTEPKQVNMEIHRAMPMLHVYLFRFIEQGNAFHVKINSISVRFGFNSCINSKNSSS